MTTSGVITGSMTARDVCTTAAQELGVYSAGETLGASDAAEMMKRLTWMLKSWQSLGCNLWREEEGEIVFAIGEKTLELDPRCIDVIEARFQQSATFQLQMQRWELGEYTRIPNKDQPGATPLAFYLRKLVDSVTMTLWPVPTLETTILYTYARVIEDVTDLNQTLDVPQQWMETVYMNLAARCASMFGATRLDAATVNLIGARAAILEQQLLDQDRPASIFMGNVFDNNF
jgi:hypothetical protein